MQFLRVFDDVCDKAIRYVMAHSGLSFTVLIALTLALFFNNILHFPQIDRNEAEFASLLQSFFAEKNVFNFSNSDYIGIFGYWLHIPLAILMGEGSELNITAYRIISLIGCTFLIISTFLLGRRLFGREAGLISALLIITPLILQYEMIFSGITTLLAAIIIINYYALSCLWRRDMMDRDIAFSNRHFFTFWLSLIFATLISGFALILILLPIIGLSLIKKEVQWLAPLQIHFGAIISAIIVLPPLLVISHLSDLSLLQIFFGTEDFSAFINKDLYADHWPFQYLLGHVIWGWPVILLSPVAIAYSLKNRTDDRFTFAVWSLILLWVFAEILPVKFLWVGVILTVFVTVIIAGTFIKFINDDFQMPKGIFLISVTIYMFASLCLAVKIPYLSHFLTGSLDPILVICSVISLIIAAGNIYMLSHNLMHGIVIGLLLQISVLFGYFNNFYGNHFETLDIPTRIEDAVTRTGCATSALYVSGYDHPHLSLKFGKNVKLLSTEEMNKIYKKATPCTIFIIGENHKDFVAQGNSSELLTIVDIENYQTIMLEIYKR